MEETKSFLSENQPSKSQCETEQKGINYKKEFKQFKGKCCKCPCTAFFSSPICIALSILIIDLFAIIICVYDISIISLISYFALIVFIILFIVIKLIHFVNDGVCKQECSKDEFFISKEQLEKLYVDLYEYSNNSIQYLRKIMIGSEIILTLKSLGLLYLTSYFAYLFGDFVFVILLINIGIIAPYVYFNHSAQIIPILNDIKAIIKEKTNLVINKIPKYSDLQIVKQE